MAVPKKDPKYIAVLALICVLILWVGAVIRPRGQQSEAASTSVTGDILLLERISQRRDVELIAEYFAYVAAQVEGSVVLLGASGHSGVIWQAGEVLTSARRGPFPSGDRTALGNREVELVTQLAGPHLPYVLLQAPMDAVVSSRAPVRLYARGSWLLAVWRSLDGGLRYSSGNRFGLTARQCGDVELFEVQTNLDFDSMPPGSGIFTLDGNLIAIALECGGGLIAVEVDALASRIRSEPTFEQRLMTRYGMRADQAGETELQFLGRPSSVIVREVWWGYRAHQAGLLPGDLILAIDDAPVDELTDLEVLTLPVSREVHELQVWRARRRMRLQLLARAATEVAASTHGFVGEEGGLEIESVIHSSLAAQAGARQGDRLLAVNQRTPESFADLEDVFRRTGDEPMHLVLERRGRMWGVLVQANE